MGTKKAPGTQTRLDFHLIKQAHQRALERRALYPTFRVEAADVDRLLAALIAECPDPQAVLSLHRDEKKGRKKHVRDV